MPDEAGRPDDLIRAGDDAGAEARRQAQAVGVGGQERAEIVGTARPSRRRKREGGEAGGAASEERTAGDRGRHALFSSSCFQNQLADPRPA
jgi:hypothetical protein